MPEESEPIDMEDVSGEVDLGGEDVPVFPGDTPETPEEAPKKKRRFAKSEKASKKRENASELLGMLWGGAGKLLERADHKGKPYGSYPTGRVMQFQSLVAGNYLDTVVQNTWIDRLLIQPLARANSTAEGIGALVALPAMIYAVDKKPAMAEVTEPWLRAAFMQTITDMAPVVKKMEAEQEKRIQAMQDAGMLMGGEGQDPFEAFMLSLFQPPNGAPVNEQPPVPQPEPAQQPRTPRPRRPKSGIS